VFTVDAGWYGTGTGLWQQQVGDWNEKLYGAFYGRMSEFANQVRAAGLGFGLWIEPERYHPATPVVKEHPNWFLPGNGTHIYPDLANRQVYEYVLNNLLRIVEFYNLVWMKIDFNLELGTPADGLHGYYLFWYSLLDELRARCPHAFIEGCASGGMRLDLHTLAHFDGHFLSDTVNPVDVLRITQ
jgi:alpha-galactosidase